MENLNIQIVSMLEYKGELWALINNFNGLVKIKKDTLEIEKTYHIEGEDDFAACLYLKMLVENDFLICIPFCAQELAVFDIKKEKFSKIKLRSTKPMKYIASAIYDKFLYLFPCFADEICRVDLKSLCVEYMEDWNEFVFTEKNSDNELYFRDVTIVNDILYAPFAQTNVIFEFNLKTNTSKKFSLQLETTGYKGIIYARNNFWLITKSGEILETDKDFKSIQVIFDSKVKDGFLTIEKINKYIWCVPYNYESVIRIDVENRTLNEFYINEISNIDPGGRRVGCIIKENNNELFITTDNCKKIELIDIDFNIINSKEKLNDKKYFSVLKSRSIKRTNYENNDLKLRDWIEEIKNVLIL